MKKFFKVELRTPLPLAVTPCPFKYDITMMDGEATVTINHITANRAQEVIFFAQVFFPQATHITVWDMPEKDTEVSVDDITDVGHFNEGAMRVLMPVQELIDLQVMLASNAMESGVSPSMQVPYETSLEVVSSRLSFTRGDDVYVGMFAAKMIEALRNSGRTGWQTPEFTDFALHMRLQKALYDRDYVSLANYAMFAYWRGVAPWSA